MGILGLIFRAVREAVQEKSAKNSLEDKLGRKVSTNDLYSLGAHLDASQPTNVVQQPMQSTPREASVPFGDAKPPMKTRTKLLLIGIPLLFLGLLFVSAFVAMMPERTYNRLNPFTPKPPEGAFPAKVGAYNLDITDYIAPSSYNPVTHFESEYKSGSETVRYTLWVYNSEAEMNADFEKRKKAAGGASENGKVVDNSDTRYAVAAMSGWTNAVVYKDGNYIKQITAYRQQPALDFEGFLKNAPPAQASTFNVSELKSANNTNSSSSTNNSSVTVGQLLEEYKKDAAAADKKYKNKTITISGTAEFADKDKKGNPMVGFMKPGSTKPADGMVVCSFDKSQEAAVLKIKKGDAVKLQGKVIANIIFSVMLENCTKL